MRARSEPRPGWRDALVALSIAAIGAARPHSASPIVGSWRESGWKLCRPAAQLTAADMDAPIDDLTFRDDGTFSVTWRGGGAHTGDIPHVFIPDYSGHYTVEPVAGRITLRIDDGLFVPGDFSGDGTYATERHDVEPDARLVRDEAGIASSRHL